MYIIRTPYKGSSKSAAPAELGKGFGSNASLWAIGREWVGAGGFGSREAERRCSPAIFSSGGAKFEICNLEVKPPRCPNTKAAAFR